MPLQQDQHIGCLRDHVAWLFSDQVFGVYLSIGQRLVRSGLDLEDQGVSHGFKHPVIVVNGSKWPDCSLWVQSRPWC